MPSASKIQSLSEEQIAQKLNQATLQSIREVVKTSRISDKIISLEQMAELTKSYRERKYQIVHCHGVFDLLHIGHIRYFEQARSMGDVLIVTLTPDRFVDKGPHRPAFPESLRAEAIASLNCVDYVSVNQWQTAAETLRLLRPHVYVKGSEFEDLSNDITGKIKDEAEVVEEIGARLAFTEDIVFSSTNLINRHLSNLSTEINNYLELFRRRYTLDHILAIIDQMAQLKVLVIGDTIIDEYQYCEAIGKSSKDPTLVLKYQSQDRFAGGVLAVANHAANFAGKVQLLTVLGENQSHESFIRSQLNSDIKTKFYFQTNAPTTVKLRYLDSYSFNKLLEIYDMDDSGLAANKDLNLRRWLKYHLSNFDLVLAVDFGHGAISNAAVKVLVENSPFLAVNTQANAGNRGFHTISRYTDMNYASIASHELRLETRNRSGHIRPKMRTLLRKINCRQMAVTLGRSGCAVCDKQGAFVKVPSFAQNVVDRVGAGDAFLSITSLAARLGVDNELIAFIGNVVGALAVGVIGNKKAIDKMSVKKYITSLMK